MQMAQAFFCLLFFEWVRNKLFIKQKRYHRTCSSQHRHIIRFKLSFSVFQCEKLFSLSELKKVYDKGLFNCLKLPIGTKLERRKHKTVVGTVFTELNNYLLKFCCLYHHSVKVNKKLFSKLTKSYNSIQIFGQIFPALSHFRMHDRHNLKCSN